MRILLLVHSFNSLSQRVFVELDERGHEVSVEFDVNDANTIEAVELFSPDVIIAPFLKRAIPEAIWKNHLCLIVHPGIEGDKGPSAVDWAILKDEKQWGVTVLQADEEMDAGPVWATRNFDMREATKSSLYRNEVTNAALDAVLEALGKVEQRSATHLALDDAANDLHGTWQPAMKQSDRQINWHEDNTQTVLRKIRSADGVPGLHDELYGRKLFLFDGREAVGLEGGAGEVIARSGPALCRATTDGAVWIGHVRDRGSDHPFKLPATCVLSELLPELPEIPVDSDHGYREISVRAQGAVCFLSFDFYNGAMSTDQCERLLEAYVQAAKQDTRVIVLEGGDDFWSNGMHLNVIEASQNPAEESWRNINAINDLAKAIIETTSHLTIAAISGNAGAGGVFLARACDEVWVREGVLLNPHYKDMGNLYGSEYWSYLLPRFVGAQKSGEITNRRLPMGASEAVRLGLADRSFGGSTTECAEMVEIRASEFASADQFNKRIAFKRQRRLVDEGKEPLADYRREELAKMKQNFFGFDPSYHVARYNFVYKVAKSRTPVTLARHRDQRPDNPGSVDQRHSPFERKVS